MAQPAAPPFLAGLTEEEIVAALQLEHPVYAARRASWDVLLDAFEGSGGFLSGDYLWEYPREDTRAFAERKKQARYHNYVESLVDLYVRFIFTQGVARASKSDEYNDWLRNVDGRNMTIDELMRSLLSFALVSGHAGVLIDKTQDEPSDATKAGERARTIAALFYASAIPDWRHGPTGLDAIKLIEAAPPGPITEPVPTGDDARQYLLWNRSGWARFSAAGDPAGAAEVNLGLVPFVVLRPKPSYVDRMVGRPIVSNANVLKALFNRSSEEDEVLRSQAFSLLTVEVGEEQSVDDARAALGAVGTSKAVVVAGEVDYKTPDQEVPRALREAAEFLVRELYRAAHVRFQHGGLQRESAEAIRLQYTELNEALQGIATRMADAERQIARAWFAWNAPTPEAAQQAFEAAGIEITYPDEFFVDALLDDLEAWAQGLAMDLGPTMSRRIKKRAARRIDPDMPADVQAQVDKEIDEQPDAPPAGDPAGPLDTGDPEGAAIRRQAHASDDDADA